ncbi:AMP-binding protein [Rhizobiales bacterium]|uniref:class I adenylate-forming enzyme family protein n=1 Tax=Hongsoonwoonella zoysiae TaxID=2821844 RepID=UPI00155F919C|nr:AMP-binding protein [Hongsoonwoonella zoysiae]NRG17452.1 AMP-binding protein [Hongsoonwoonella zoysiae]
MTIDRWIAAHACFSPDKPAIRFHAGDLTYAELDRAIGKTAHWLACERGIKRGERIAYLGTNAPDMLMLLFAAARTGIILVPLNWRLAPPELAYAVSDSGVKLLIHQPAFGETVSAILADPLLGSAASVEACEIDPAAGGLAALLANGESLEAGDGEETDPLLIVYTSGTTGSPKGAVLSQRAILVNALNARHMHDMREGDLVLTVLPMFHVGGLNIQTTPALYLGATVILHERFHPRETLAAISAEKPTLTVLVPATLAAMISHPEWKGHDLSSLRAIATGSSDVPLGLMTPFIERGVPVIQIYGSTETTPVAIYQRIEDIPAELGAIGRPGLHTRARIILPDGNEAPPGEVGEIEILGEHVATGYWNLPEETEKTFRDGWFRTGDLGLVDPNGLFWFKDRLKNVIISGGENIYPAELERVLRELDFVKEATVIGRPDPRWGEVPVAVVVPKDPGQCDEAHVLQAFEGRIARYKHPKTVVFAEELPRNALGKIRIDQVREMAAGKVPGGQER